MQSVTNDILPQSSSFQQRVSSSVSWEKIKHKKAPSMYFVSFLSKFIICHNKTYRVIFWTGNPLKMSLDWHPPNLLGLAPLTPNLIFLSPVPWKKSFPVHPCPQHNPHRNPAKNKELFLKCVVSIWALPIRGCFGGRTISFLVKFESSVFFDE